MTSLRDAQTLFWRGLYGDLPAPAAVLRGDATLDAKARMRVYAESVDARMHEALALTYPLTADLLGAGPFAALCRACLRAHPPRHFSLQYTGEALPEYLATANVRPDAAELCRLEHMHAEVFEAEDSSPIGMDALASRGTEVATTRLVMVAALRHGPFAHDVIALADGDRPARPLRKRCEVVVWRREFRVVHTALPEPAAEALRLAAAGATVGEVCESFAGCVDPPAAAFAALGAWFADGWVARVL